MSTLRDCLLRGEDDSELYGRLLDETTTAEWPALLALATHPDPAVRKALVATLPLLEGEAPPPAWIAAAIALTADPDIRVRDHACFALGRQWKEVDTPELRDALAARLDDLDRDVRSEALFGLALRRDDRVRSRVLAALSRPSGSVWRLEMLAAGALGDPALYPYVLNHLEGWDDDDRWIEAVRRLTDPSGPGTDLLRQVADLCVACAHGREVADTSPPAWRLLEEMTDIAPHRAQELVTAVAGLLVGDPAAIRHLHEITAVVVGLESPSG